LRTYIFLGAPGAGKGTMAKLFCARLGCIHVSTGDIFREELAAGSELGERVRSILASGALVSDEVVGEIVQSRLGKKDVLEHGFLLDGFPRTFRQAELLDDILEAVGLPLTRVVLLEANRELLLKRLTARRSCGKCGAVFNDIFSPSKKPGICDTCGNALKQRPDDKLETVTSRLDLYNQETAPLVGLYEQRDVLSRVDSGGAADENFVALCDALGV